MMTRENTYTIQQAAEETGLTSYTLRYYEDIGLLDPIQRADNGHRRYTEADIRRIKLLKRLRRTNMSIEDMQHFVEMYRQGNETVTERREMMEAHRRNVQAQIDELYEILAFIDHKIETYIEQEEQTHNERKWECNVDEVSPVGENGTAGI